MMIESPHEWIKGHHQRGHGPTPGSQYAVYSLRHLADRGLLPLSDVNSLLIQADLEDFSWRLVWQDSQPTPDETLPKALTDVEGYVLFMHGWTGSHAIWEDMPAAVLRSTPRLVSLVVDHNGFGESPFADRTPEYEECSPIGAMRVIERWLGMTRLRRQVGDPKPKTVNFVGHSMGGAALFFLDEARWRVGEQTRTALAPALLIDDELGRAFFTTLGLGIGLVGRLQFLEAVERLVSPRVLDTLTAGASDEVKQEHQRIYAQTPRSVTARVLAAMGTLRDQVLPRRWDWMQVFLGHKDVLVNLIPMMDLLYELNFDVEQVRTVMGTHYFFSVGDDWARVHRQNRTLVVEQILALHQRAYTKQRYG